MTHATAGSMSAAAVSTRVPVPCVQSPEVPSAFVCESVSDVTTGEAEFCVPVSPEMVTLAAAAPVPVLST